LSFFLFAPSPLDFSFSRFFRNAGTAFEPSEQLGHFPKNDESSGEASTPLPDPAASTFPPVRLCCSVDSPQLCLFPPAPCPCQSFFLVVCNTVFPRPLRPFKSGFRFLATMTGSGSFLFPSPRRRFFCSPRLFFFAAGRLWSGTGDVIRFFPLVLDPYSNLYRLAAAGLIVAFTSACCVCYVCGGFFFCCRHRLGEAFVIFSERFVRQPQQPNLLFWLFTVAGAFFPCSRYSPCSFSPGHAVRISISFDVFGSPSRFP